MDQSRRLSIDLLEALVEAWEQAMEPEDVQYDLEKLTLLRAAFTALPYRHEIPKRILTFYHKVFLRDLWVERDCNQGHTKP